MSIEKHIYNHIVEKGSISIDEIHAIAEESGHKQAAVERKAGLIAEKRMATPIYDDKGILKGYKKIEAPKLVYSSRQQQTLLNIPIKRKLPYEY